ncbi:phosphoesterase family-domain-containing protein, partial [Halteromyces radiatus]|uniref:phosphoesterase family-domain-containing protein n=1 Tax=Halteromyces radiatus TaxID=101107 RepID=UPI00221E4E33
KWILFLSIALTFIITPINAIPFNKRASHQPNDSSSLVPGKFFDRVVIFIFENIDYADAANNTYFKSLAPNHNGVELTNFTALTHPSQPNYIGLISGATEGCVDDDLVNMDRDTIVDLLEKKGVSWKTYQEDYPGGCNDSMYIGKYARKHNPFISFKNIRTNPDRCAKIVNATELDDDIANDTVPQFIFYTPNLDHDAHDTDLNTAATWFQSFLEPRIKQANFTKNTMFVSTFDEAKHYTLIPNSIQTVLFGPDFKRKSNVTTDNTPYNHYSILRTIEDNVSLKIQLEFI